MPHRLAATAGRAVFRDSAIFTGLTATAPRYAYITEYTRRDVSIAVAESSKARSL